VTRKPKTKTQPPEAPRATVSRRGFLAIAGATLGSTVLPTSLTACNPGGPAPAPDFTTTLLRPEDLLSLTLNFFNLSLSGDGTKLEPINASNTAYISVDFGPEHVLEQAFEEGVAITYPKFDPNAPPVASPDDPSTAPGSPISSLISGRSRVVFVVPSGQSLVYSVDGLLAAFSTLQMNVPGNATPSDGVTVTTPMKLLSLALHPRQQRILALRQSLGIPSTDGLGQPLRTLAVVPNPIPIPIPQRPPLPAPPAELETALELPTRLILSPNTYAGWAHATGVVTSSTNRTEVWHTRLGIQVAGSIDESDTNAAARTVRAVWTRDPGFQAAQDTWASGPTDPTVNPNPNMTSAPPAPFPRASLLPQNRADIVYESGNFGTFRRPRSPKAVQANRVILSALGGWLDVRGNFGGDTDSGLELWEHKATMGRDHYVKVVYSGILYPWGNHASLLKITERRLTNNFDPAEALWSHYYIIVRQPTVVYDPGSDVMMQQTLRALHFTQLTITTLSTPELNPPPSMNGAFGATPAILVGTGDPYLFKMVGRDHAGNDIHFEAPAVWAPTKAGVVTDDMGNPAGDTKHLQDLWNLFPDTAKTSPTKGQRIAYAPEVKTDTPGKTTFETHSLTHTGAKGTNFPKVTSGNIPFVPQLQTADVVVEALRGFADTGSTAVNYHSIYVTNGFDGGVNLGEVLLELPSKPGVVFSQHTDKGGGFVAPNIEMTAISRKHGPTGGTPDKIAQGTFDKNDFFSSISSIFDQAKIFGVIKFTDIISDLATDLEKAAPKFLTEALNEVDQLIADAKAIKQIADDVASGASSLGSVASLQATLSDIPARADAIVAAIVTSTPDATAAQTAIDALRMDLHALPGQLDAGAQAAGLPVTLTQQLKQFSAPLASALDTLSTTIGPLLTAYQDLQDLAKTQTFKLDWSVPLQPFNLGGSNLFDPQGNKSFFLKAEMRLKASGGKPAGVDLVCGIDPFDINLLGGTVFITVHVDTLQFALKAGSKPDVSAGLKDPGLEFKGPLSFVQTLTSIIPLDGFLDPPGLSVDASGITASFSIPIPSLAIGVFALTNISIGASLHIPFIGSTPLTVGFNFCTRDEPFCLTVMFIGGGGFFGVTFDPHGVQILEASFDAGACLAVDFGVASGSISAMIGVYFKMEGDAATLTGFFRLRGEVDVLGIISASIELYLELTYESASGKVTGHAELTIDVKIVFFHIGVKISCTKRFAGGNGDPSFLQMMSPWDPVADLKTHNDNPDDFALLPTGYDPWAEYLLAFAA
jgi:hypothetical protein